MMEVVDQMIEVELSLQLMRLLRLLSVVSDVLDVVEVEQHVVAIRTWRSLRSFLVWWCGAIRMRRSS